MARLGSNSKPTSTQEWSGANTNNQNAIDLTLPAGGPWRITDVGGWFAGKDAAATFRFVIWSSDRNTVLAQSASFNACGHSFGLGNSDNYEKPLTSPLELAGGTTIYVGWHCDPDEPRQWGRYSSGDHYDDSTSSETPVAMSGETDDNNGALSAYVYYEAAETAPLAPTNVKLENTASGNILTNSDSLWLLTFEGNDETGDTLASYDYQIDTTSGNGVEPDWASLTASVVARTDGILDATEPGQNVSSTITHALSDGQWYALRVRTKDDGGNTGAWSATYFFKTATNPTATLTEPSATGRLGKLSYTAGSGWASPRLNVGWSMSCPDGGTQTHYEVEVNNDSAGAVGSSLYDSGQVAGSGKTLVVPATLTEGAYYHVRVRLWCSHGEVSAFTGYFRIRARWGFTMHERDLGAAPTTWSITTLSTTTTASSAVVVEYNSSADGTTLPDPTWKSSIASVTLRRYFRYRVWLLAWGASPATSPSLNQLVLSYTASVLSPDKWTREDAVNSYASTTTYVYGTQSLQMNGDGALMRVSQLVTVVPNTNYILSGRIKSLGDSGAQIRLGTSQLSEVVASSDELVATADWDRYQTPVWNSGANTSIWVQCRIDGAVGTGAWFDALKLEASSVVTPWVPGFVGSAVVLDAGGLQIDGSAGGIFRLRGSAGGTRDRVDLGTKGLQFGGDVDVYSEVANILSIPRLRIRDAVDVSLASTAHSFGIGPDSGLNLGMEADEIQARNNGAAAELFINNAGGLINVGGSDGLVGLYPVVSVFTANGTWNKPTGLNHAIVMVQGGGGAGGGADASAAGEASQGGGGGAGGFAWKLFDAADLAGDTTFDVVVGAAKTGTSGASGGAGNASSFAGTGITTVQGNGGGGGEYIVSGTTRNLAEGGDGGTASGGDYNISGGDGGAAPRLAASSQVVPSYGGASVLGGAAKPITASGSGRAGKNYGGGGTGAYQQGAGSARTGGTGAQGIVIVIAFRAP